VKQNATFAQIAEILRTRQRFVVMSHVRPDGDALGCEIAMGLCLQALGKDVTVWNQDGVPDKFRFLPGSEIVQQPSAEPREFDVAVVIDTAVENRIGTCHAAIRKADVWINIDHHISNNHYGDLPYIDSTAPAAGQVLVDFFRDQGFPISRAMADNLYVAISTDTGSFQYPNTTARTYEIAAQLVAAGVNVGDLAQKMYESYPRRRLELLREVLNSLRFSAAGRIASFSLSIATVDKIGAKAEDNEGLIDYIRAVDGVVAAAFFEELPEGKVRISLRSKDPRVDVCKVCARFGGGGHVLAAGARLAGTLAEVEERVIAAIAEEVAALPSA
jgi:phosphoesterase RecJ-like protein